MRASTKIKVPVVLTREEVAAVLALMDGTIQRVARSSTSVGGVTWQPRPPPVLYALQTYPSPRPEQPPSVYPWPRGIMVRSGVRPKNFFSLTVVGG